ncbi:hypothetical protein Tco_0544188 [Tanacetum coccineum]
MLAIALEFNWVKLSHEIGLWIPVNIINTEHDEESEGDDDFIMVVWGLTHRKESAYECCQACINQAKAARADEMNVIYGFISLLKVDAIPRIYIYQHKLEECWLKYVSLLSFVVELAKWKRVRTDIKRGGLGGGHVSCKGVRGRAGFEFKGIFGA